MSSLPIRHIGQNKVSAIGYGAMGMSIAYGPVPSDEELQKVHPPSSFYLLDKVYVTGCTFWDTADLYGDSEEVIGKWFARTGKRANIFLATKFGFVPREDTYVIDGSPEHMRKQFANSLKSLQTDYVDLYYLHRPDIHTPIEVTVEAMAELVKESKVKYLGLSECSPTTLRRAHAVHPIAAIQVEYSPFTLDIEAPKIALLHTARELGVKIVAYSPLGRGLLTGRYRSPEDFEEGDFRNIIPRYSEENFPRILRLVESIKAVGERYGATAGQTALAWVLGQGDDVIPIPGTMKVKYLLENVGSARIKLKPEELEEIEKAAIKADPDAGGARYPPGSVEMLFADTHELKA